MGSGFLANAAALRAIESLSPEERKRASDTLGAPFFVTTFARGAEWEDFATTSKEGAELVAKGLLLEMKGNPFAKTDVVEIFNPVWTKTKYKVAFFK